MGVSNTSAARVIGIDSQYAPPGPTGSARLAQSVGMVGQGNDGVGYSLDPVLITSPAQALDLYGGGSPLHSMAKVLLPPNGSGLGSAPLTAYPVDAAGGFVAAFGTAGLGVHGTSDAFEPIAEDSVLQFTLADVVVGPIALPKGLSLIGMIFTVVALIESLPDSPFISDGDLGVFGFKFTCKWKGTSGNNLVIRAEWLEGGGTWVWDNIDTTFGNGTPDVTSAVDSIQNRQETFLANGFNPSQSTVLDSFDELGEQQWRPLRSAPLMAITGLRDPSLAFAKFFTVGRELDRTNVLVQLPGADAPHYTIAAESVARVVEIANDDPARDYQGQIMQNILIGPNAAPFTAQERNEAVASGVSTVRTEGGAIALSDMVTMYRPDDGTAPAFRNVVDNVRLQNIIEAFSQAFDVPEWQGVPFVPDSQAITSGAARKPMDARALAASVVDSLGADALISNVAASKETITAGIDPGNPRRINLGVTVFLSSNANTISIDLNFGLDSK